MDRRARVDPPVPGRRRPNYVVDPPVPGRRRPNYVVDPEAIDAVARAWADAGPVSRVHRAAQKDLRRSFPLLAEALDRLTGERPR